MQTQENQVAHSLTYPVIQIDDKTYNIQTAALPELQELVIGLEASLSSIDLQLSQENGRDEAWKRRTLTVRNFKLRQLGIITREMHRRQPNGGGFAEVFLAMAREKLDTETFNDLWQAACRVAPIPSA